MAELVDDTTVCTSVEVSLTPARAFELFTAGIGSWWDEDKHILQAPLAEMVFEPFVGGHIIDRGTDGSECRWSRVLAYEPPHRVAFSWDIDVRWQIEPDPERCSEIEITFTPTGERATRVELIHRHLDRHGPGWESMRDAVAGGWSLDGFARRAGLELGELPTVSDETMQARLAQVKHYTLMLLHATEKCAQPDARAIIWEHGRRNMALVEAGELQIVMPLSDDGPLAGIGIFTGDLERVAAIVDGDPAVQAGLFTYELHPVRGFPGAALR